ncbi:MAG: hypothetical protein WBC70_16905 [Candidatus Aminicenantales bacterium]
MRPAFRIVSLAAVAGLFALAARAYLGHEYFHRYTVVRGKEAGLQGSFDLLEPRLMRAVSFSGNPVFYQEVGRRYLEMALAENKFGAAEKREAYLDRAREYLEGLIRRNPLDAFGYYDLGRVYMLYNYPLLTYAAKGRTYLRKALEMRPVDPGLNVDVIYAYLAQWERLSAAERDFIYAAVARSLENDAMFFPRILALWKGESKSPDRLKAIFSENSGLWAKLAGFFPAT